MWTAIILGFLLFMFLIVVHELGHFIAAKRSGVKVLEFGIWIPPRAMKIYTDKSWTEYSLNWIPLWWFVRLKGEDPNDEGTFYAKDSFITQTVGKKLLILLWWVAVNVLFAWLFFASAFWKWIEPIWVLPDSALQIQTNSYLMPTQGFLDEQWFLSGEIQAEPVKIKEIIPDELAYNAGLKTWDVIKKINDNPVDTLNLWSTLRENIGKEFELTYKRNDELQTKKLECERERCLLGIIMPQWGNLEVLPIKFWFVQWSKAAAWEIYAQTRLTFHVLGNIFSRLLTFERQQAKEAVEQLAWPVWAVKVWEIILDNFWIWQFVAFGGMISLALAIFNILPIPALDWWRTIWVLIQTVVRLKPEKYFIIENYFNVLFFVLLMSLWIYIIFLDLARFWWVNPFGF